MSNEYIIWQREGDQRVRRIGTEHRMEVAISGAIGKPEDKQKQKERTETKSTKWG